MILRKKEDVITRRVAGEMLLVPLRGKLADLQKLFVVEGIGEFVWESLDGRLSVEEICDRVVKDFDVGADSARSDINRFIAELKDAGLVVEG